MRITLLLISFILVACQQDDGSSQGNFVAYSWSDADPQYSNLIPFHWLRSEDFHDFDVLIKNAKSATDKMPAGHRVLFSWNVHRLMAYQKNEDFIYAKNGDIAGCNSQQGFIPYRSLWWDNGVKAVQQRFEKFFEAYVQIGGKLDVFVLDFEQGFTYWHLKELADNHYPCGLDAYLDAIQNDVRFSEWEQLLGFDDLKTLNQWYENDHHLKWLAVVWEHLAGYINKAVYQPLKKYFPDAELSNYGYYYQNSVMNFPDVNGYYRHRYTDGIHVGTHQSREIYGWVDLPKQTRLAQKPYPTTSFNAFRFALNKLRAMLLSSDIPVSPWIAYKGFSNSSLKNSDYYQELILHILLSGVDYLLYWNPVEQADFSADNDELLNRLIQQVNNLVEQREISFQTTELVHWLDDAILTKVEFEDGEKLWRLTANLEDQQKLSNYIINLNPAKLKIKGSEFSFDDMRVLETENAISDKGLWLVSSSPK